MKKIMTMIVTLLCVIMASCGSKSVDPQVVADKLQKGEALTEADYSAMIDYCSDYAEHAQKYFDIINSEPNDSTEAAIKATDELATLYNGAKYLDSFRTALFNADASELGEKNAARIAELSKYEAFPISDVSDSSMLNPDVVGDIEQMPANPADTVVIADGAGEAVESNK